MNILYLTEDYLYSKVHNNLLCNMLDQDYNLRVYVFSPSRSENPHGIEDSYRKNDRLMVVTPKIDIPIWLYKYDFWAKLRCKVRLIERYIPLKEINFIHAATLFAEGGTAYRLKKKYGLPYLAAIRGADVMTYSRKMPHLWPIGNKILNYASAVSCVTPAIKNRIVRLWQYKPSHKTLEQALIINNGLDTIWTENLNLEPRELGIPVRILYIGRFDNNKNVIKLVEAVKQLKRNYDVSITLIGGKGEEHDAVIQQVAENKTFMEYLGPIYDKQQLMAIVRKCDIFAMVSHSETFGLVYAECLTQGLPLLYSKGTGFDQFFPEGEVGYGVDSYSLSSIEQGLIEIINYYSVLRKNISMLDFDCFSWIGIARSYYSLYCSFYKR